MSIREIYAIKRAVWALEDKDLIKELKSSYALYNRHKRAGNVIEAEYQGVYYWFVRHEISSRWH